MRVYVCLCVCLLSQFHGSVYSSGNLGKNRQIHDVSSAGIAFISLTWAQHVCVIFFFRFMFARPYVGVKFFNTNAHIRLGNLFAINIHIH